MGPANDRHQAPTNGLKLYVRAVIKPEDRNKAVAEEYYQNAQSVRFNSRYGRDFPMKVCEPAHGILVLIAMSRIIILCHMMIQEAQSSSKALSHACSGKCVVWLTGRLDTSIAIDWDVTFKQSTLKYCCSFVGNKEVLVIRRIFP